MEFVTSDGFFAEHEVTGACTWHTHAVVCDYGGNVLSRVRTARSLSRCLAKWQRRGVASRWVVDGVGTPISRAAFDAAARTAL